jgi:hypothetical protein
MDKIEGEWMDGWFVDGWTEGWRSIDKLELNGGEDGLWMDG